MQAACTYLASNYNSSMGLIAETPSHERYFLYSDNFLASLVLSNDCGNSNLNRSISNSLAAYDPRTIPNQYMVFECLGPYFNGSKDYRLSDNILTTINNQTGPPLNDSYADIALLRAYYDYVCARNMTEAITDFNASVKEYHEFGFIDAASTPCIVTPCSRLYQTYKLALCIILASLLDQPIRLSVVQTMMKMQDNSTGGFYTGYTVGPLIPVVSVSGTTNTETTCLVIMAMEAALG